MLDTIGGSQTISITRKESRRMGHHSNTGNSDQVSRRHARESGHPWNGSPGAIHRPSPERARRTDAPGKTATWTPAFAGVTTRSGFPEVRSIAHSNAGERHPSLQARVAALLLGVLSSMALMSSAPAATITVGNTGDPATGNAAKCNVASTCTLRDAIASAAAVTDGSGDTIVFSLPAGSTITLGGTRLVVDRNLTIDGSAVSGLVISANHESGVFRINEHVTATLTHLALSNGDDEDDYSGDGIFNSGTLMLDSSSVSDNTGFGIYIERGNVELTSVMVSGNTKGGIYNRGSLALTNSKITDNILGGGIYNNGGDLVLTHSTVSNNISFSGGGIYNSGRVTVTKSTISGNSSGEGGGIHNDSFGQITLSASKVINNTGGGIWNWGTLSLTDGTVSGNTGTGGISNILDRSKLTVTDSEISRNESNYDGGGIDNAGTMTLINSTVSSNSSRERGGGIFNLYGVAQLLNSTISDNIADLGAGVFNQASTLVLTNSTISGNKADSLGSGILNHRYGKLTLTQSSVAGNTRAGTDDDVHNIFDVIVIASISNTIIQNCTSDADSTITLTDHGGNLDGGTGCGFTSPSSKSNATLDLGALADNGGPTPTMRPGMNSDAVGFGLPSVCESEPVNGRDQRGYARSPSACTSGAMDPGSPDGPIDSNQRGLSGAWADPTTESQGLIVEIGPDFYGTGTGLLFAGWYTFDITAAGGQRWYTLQGQVNGATPASVGIHSTTGGRFDSSQPTATQEVGRARLAFHDCTRGTLDYTFTDGSDRRGSIPLTRLLSNETCSPSGDSGVAATATLLSGAWADTGNSGQGLVFDMNAADNVVFGGWYTFAPDANGEDPRGQHWYTLQARFKPGTHTPNSVGIYESTGGLFNLPADTWTVEVGMANLVFNTCTSATLQYTFTRGPNSGRTGTLDLTRVGAAPSGCQL
ncbi:MAG: right-handed parallel beta-helix repeat-containing protein [Xanthomonadales bacterium]|nr:right-handed parallel beta-helix repeat-containing protein [Xanthomonadales bacterium]